MTLTASKAKEKFGEALDAARRKEVVTITRQGKPAAALIDIEEYEHLRRLEDAYWIARAEEARKGGFLGHEESMRFLVSRMEETDEEEGE